MGQANRRAPAIPPVKYKGVRPQYWPFPYFQELPASPVIPYIMSLWRWFSEPLARSKAWHFSLGERPRYYPFIPYNESFGAYEAFLQFDATQYDPTAEVLFEVILRSAGGTAVAARLFNITDGIFVTGSTITTTNTSNTRLRSAALTLTGTKEYRAEVRVTPNETTTVSAARLVVRQ